MNGSSAVEWIAGQRSLSENPSTKSQSTQTIQLANHYRNAMIVCTFPDDVMREDRNRGQDLLKGKQGLRGLWTYVRPAAFQAADMMTRGVRTQRIALRGD